MKLPTFEEIVKHKEFDTRFGLCMNLQSVVYGSEDLFHLFLDQNGYSKFPVGNTRLIKNNHSEAMISRNSKLYFSTENKFKGTQLKLRKQLYNQFIQWAQEHAYASTN